MINIYVSFLFNNVLCVPAKYSINISLTPSEVYTPILYMLYFIYFKSLINKNLPQGLMVLKSSKEFYLEMVKE